MYLTSHPRLVFTFPSLRPVALTHYSRKPFPVNAFADPYPLTPVTSTFYRNGGRGPLFLTSLLHYLLTSSSLSPFPATFMDRAAKCCKQKSYASPKPFRCNIYNKRGGRPRPTQHNSPTTLYPKRYLSRGSASDVLLEPAVPSAKLFTGHGSVVSKYVYLRGGCDG